MADAEPALLRPWGSESDDKLRARIRKKLKRIRNSGATVSEAVLVAALGQDLDALAHAVGLGRKKRGRKSMTVAEVVARTDRAIARFEQGEPQ